CRVELLAETLHVRIDRPRRDARLHAPNAFEQNPACLHAVLPLEQGDEQLELERRELNLTRTDPDPVGFPVDAQRAEIEEARGFAGERARASEERSNPEPELAAREG